MTWSQTIVVTWIQFVLTSALLLQAARFALGRLAQPVDRIRLILLSLGAVAALPLLMMLAPWPMWRLGLVAPVDEGGRAAPPITVPSDSTPVATSFDRDASTTFPPRFGSDPAAFDATFEPVHPLGATAEGASVANTASPEQAASVPAAHASLPLWNIAAISIAAAQFLVFGYTIMEWIIGGLWLRRLCRRAEQSPASVNAAWELVTHGRGRHVRLLISPSIDAPLMFGCVRPVVVVPTALADTGGGALLCCLAHEWSHVERRDVVAWRFAGLCQLLLWMQPAYWALRKELRLGQDILADDRSTQAGLDAVEYSELLVGFAKNRMPVPAAGALTLLDQPTQLTRRIQMLLTSPLSLRSRCRWQLSLGLGMAALLSTVLMASVRLDAPPADDTARESTTQVADADTEKSREQDFQVALAQDNVDAAAKPSEGSQARVTETSEVVANVSGPMQYTCRVVDKETDKGIPGVEVVVRWSEHGMEEPRIRAIQESKLKTNEQGEYLLAIPATKVADRQLYLDLTFQHETYPIGRYGNTLKEFRDREKRGDRLGFEVFRMRPGVPVTGTIVSPEGRPLSDVLVRAACHVSTGEAVSDADGKFRIQLPKEDDAALWVLPRDYGIVEQFLAKQRGDLGEIRLSAGIRVSGRVLGTDGRPIGGVPVNIQFTDPPSFGKLFGGSDIRRAMFSDAEGRFTFDPLPPGEYEIRPEEQLQDPLDHNYFQPTYALPGAFFRRKLTLKNGTPPATVELQSVPFVRLKAQVVDSSGKNVSGDEFRFYDGTPVFVSGNLDGDRWHTRVRPDRSGKFDILIPHGLQEPMIQILGSPRTESALRIRRGKGAPMVDMPGLFFLPKGPANDDIDGIEIVRYEPAKLVVAAVDEEQKSIASIRVAAVYPGNDRPYLLDGGGEPQTHVNFKRQPDGRYLSGKMQPSDGVIVTVAAAGYESASEKVDVVEGKTRELVLKLKKPAVKTEEAAQSREKPAAAAKPTETVANSPPASEKPQAAIDKPAAPPKELPAALKYTCSVVEKTSGKGIPGARVAVRRSIYTPQENRPIAETRHTTDADGKYVVEIPPEQVAEGYLYIELDVDHDHYAARKGFGYALSMIRKNEKLGERPFFEKTELYEAEPVTGVVLSPDGKPLAGVKVQSFSRADRNNSESMSFTDTQTDTDGRYRLNLHKGVDGVLWVIPKDFGIVEKFLANQRGDLGEFRVPKGIRVQGRVLSADGKPVPGVAVNIDFAGERDVGGLAVASSVGRGAISDGEGRFAFDPLPAGDYRILPEEHLSDPLKRDHTTYPVPGVFVARKISLKEGSDPAPVEIQAVPHIVFNAQIVDSAGKKTRGHEFFLFGDLDGEWWHGSGRPDQEGTIALRVPHGLKKSRVQLMTNEHGALRFRRSKGEPLQNETRDIDFGTLNDDVEGFEIVKFRAPIVLISAVDENRQPIRGFRVTATYPWGKQRYVAEGEERSDIHFEHQTDGRFRTSQMLPDEEVTIKATADGYEPASEMVKLAEGESQELVLALKKK